MATLFLDGCPIIVSGQRTDNRFLTTVPIIHRQNPNAPISLRGTITKNRQPSVRFKFVCCAKHRLNSENTPSTLEGLKEFNGGPKGIV
jgi:hypothetical protein